MSAGMLTGHPVEEMPGSLGDLLAELSQLHEQVRQEKNDLQDANIQLGVELKDIRAQLADSVKENKQLRRDIFSKCLNELFKGVRRRSLLIALCL